MGKVLHKKHKVGNFKKTLTLETFTHSHIHSLIQQTTIKRNVYWVLDVFPCRQFIVDFDNHCTEGLLHPGSQYPGGGFHLFVLNMSV